MKKTIFKKWWFWISIVILIGIVALSLWYTNVYTSEWGKGLSKEEKKVFEHVERTNKSKKNIDSLTNKDFNSLYDDMKASGIYPSKIKKGRTEINSYSDDVMTIPSRLNTIYEDFSYYKKKLSKKVKLSKKAKIISPYHMKPDNY